MIVIDTINLLLFTTTMVMIMINTYCRLAPGAARRVPGAGRAILVVLAPERLLDSLWFSISYVYFMLYSFIHVCCFICVLSVCQQLIIQASPRTYPMREPAARRSRGTAAEDASAALRTHRSMFSCVSC